MLKAHVFALLCFVAIISAQFVYEQEPQEDKPPAAIQRNSFEGTYTSNSKLGIGNMFICVDVYGQLQGSYGEYGILQAVVNFTQKVQTAKGFFFEAGTGSCIWGEFEIELTNDGFEGWFNCGGKGTLYELSERKINPFRPSDDQCAIIGFPDNTTLDGSWEDGNGYPLDICQTEVRSQGSYLREANNANFGDPLVEGYFLGTTFAYGKIISGTWYEENGAGAIIYFYRNTGELHAWRWSGLLGNQGRTLIDPSQLHNPDLHQSFIYPSHFGDSTRKECSRFSIVKEYVLKNLQNTDGDYYYFVDNNYFTSEFERRYYTSIRPQNNDSNKVVVSIVLVFVAILATLV